MEIVLAILMLAVLSTSFAYILFFSIISRAGATNTSLVTLVVPAAAILLGMAFLGEHLNTEILAGLLLIGLGLLTIDGRLTLVLKNKLNLMGYTNREP